MNSKKIHPKRGEVWWINFDPSQGTEITKTRPAVVVSNDVANKYLHRFQVVPLSSNVDKLYPGESLVKVDGKRGKTLTNQIVTASKKRFGKKLAKLTKEEIHNLDAALIIQLGLRNTI